MQSFLLKTYLFLLLLGSVRVFSQDDSTITLSFDFNEHEIKEKDNKVIPKGVGLILVSDRFGNEKSAICTQGHNFSYLTLGTSKLLKNHIMSISLWLNLERRVYEGKGNDYTPILITKNAPGEDFINAYSMIYDSNIGRLGVNSSKDSTSVVNMYSLNEVKFNNWYHVVYVCTDQYLAFYVNGELQGKSPKNFRTKFLSTDSVVIGHSASVKNLRFSQARFDDIRFFHKVLSEQEIYDLYHETNPDKFKNVMKEFAMYGSIILVLIIVIGLLVVRNKRSLRKQKEQFALINRITELELKVVKAQINPHFISNCLAAIQDLIYKNEVGKAGQYLAKFSYFLRQILNYSDKNYISLVEEIAIIKLNVELEQLRFNKEFDFKLHIDGILDVKDELIPALITQPFIENAIWHGLLPLSGIRNPELKIRVSKADHYIAIEIEDNGVGRQKKGEGTNDSKGTKLVMDKIDSLNRLSGYTKHQIDIIDLFDEHRHPSGTLVKIQIDDHIE